MKHNFFRDQIDDLLEQERSNLKMIVFSKDMNQEAKKELEHEFLINLRKEAEVRMIYEPSCECPYEQPVLLDRVPMSSKILSICQDCKQQITLTQVYPPVFYIPIIDQFIDFFDLPDMEISPGRQSPLLEYYKQLANQVSKKKDEKEQKKIFFGMMDLTSGFYGI